MLRVQRLILPGILALVGLVYGGVLYNEFVWDDHVLFIDNAALRSGPIDWTALSRPVMEGSNYFRPLVLLTWALEARLWGVNPFAAHAVNLGLHLLNVALVFVLAVRIHADLRLNHVPWRAGLAALLYGMHPCLVEVTSWVSGRFDLMATAFILGALISDAAVRNKWWRAASVSIFFALALGSKELALMMPPILLTLRLIRDLALVKRYGLLGHTLRLLRADAPTVAGLAVAFGVWFLLRFDVLGIHLSTSQITAGVSAATMLWLHTLLVFNTIWFYVGQILVPFGRMSPLHPLEFELLSESTGILRAAGGVGTLMGLGALIWRHPAQGLLASCAGLALLPVLQVVPLTSSADSIGSDRFLTLPLCFMALAITSIVVPFTDRIKGRIQVLGASVLGAGWLLLAVTTVLGTIPMWRSEWALWSWAYSKHPDEPFAQRAYIHAAMRKGRYDIVGDVFQKLRARGPLHSFLQIQYGMYLVRIGENDEAENYIKGGIAAYGIRFGVPQPAARYQEATISERLILAYAYTTLAEIQKSRGKYTEAVSDMDEVIQYLPNVPMYAAVRALLMMGDGRLQESRSTFRAAYERMTPEQKLVAIELRKQFLNELCPSRAKPLAEGCEDVGSPKEDE